MASSVITVELRPTRDLEAMMQRVAETAVAETIRRLQGGPEMEPVLRASPEGTRVLHLDDQGESHWVLSHRAYIAEEKGWRVAMVTKRPGKGPHVQPDL